MSSSILEVAAPWEKLGWGGLPDLQVSAHGRIRRENKRRSWRRSSYAQGTERRELERESAVTSGGDGEGRHGESVSRLHLEIPCAMGDAGGRLFLEPST